METEPRGSSVYGYSLRSMNERKSFIRVISAVITVHDSYLDLPVSHSGRKLYPALLVLHSCHHHTNWAMIFHSEAESRCYDLTRRQRIALLLKRDY